MRTQCEYYRDCQVKSNRCKDYEKCDLRMFKLKEEERRWLDFLEQAKERAKEFRPQEKIYHFHDYEEFPLSHLPAGKRDDFGGRDGVNVGGLQ